MLDARDIGRVRIGDVTAGEGRLVELFELARLLEHLLEARELGGGAVAPVDCIGGGELADRLDPVGNGGGERGKRGELRRCGHYQVLGMSACLAARHRSIAAKKNAAIGTQATSMRRTANSLKNFHIE
jgi:hypothetical protein